MTIFSVFARFLELQSAELSRPLSALLLTQLSSHVAVRGIKEDVAFSILTDCPGNDF